MKHWTKHQTKIRAKLGRKPLSLFLDFDGTLVPLRSYDQEVNLSPRVKRLLNELAAHPAMQISIVSGRPLQNLCSQIDNPAIFLAGNHGFEIRGPETNFLHPAAAKAKTHFRVLARELQSHLRKYPGVSLEDKTYTLSVHYRGVSSACEEEILAGLRKWLAQHSLGRRLTLQVGKKVLEIKPRSFWNKGAAMRKILSIGRGKSPMAVYIGDDVTDEDALQRLPSSGWGFKVTPRTAELTAAHSFLRNPAEVEKCLHWFKSLMK